MSENYNLKKVNSLLILGMFLFSTLVVGINILPVMDSKAESGPTTIGGFGPVSTITEPANNSIYNGFPFIYGTASIPGNTNNTTISKVEITIKRLSDNRYWDGYVWNTTGYWLLASGTWSWSYSTGSVTWTNLGSYLVRSRATDNLSRVESPKYGNKFTINASRPITIIVTPHHSYSGTYLSFISGTAKSLINNMITKVEIRIKREYDNYYWNGTGWTNLSQPWIVVGGTTSWGYNTSMIPWTTSTYCIEARATDNKSNIGSIHSIWIYIDNSKPVSRITNPLNNSFVKRLKQVSVIATDDNFTSNQSSVYKVDLVIKRLSDNKYWSRYDWVTSETWLSMSRGYNHTHWIYNTGTILWENNTQYLVRSRAADYFNNVETPGYGNMFTITMDTFYTTIIQPQNNSWICSLNEIKGYTYYNHTNINITKVQVLIKRYNDSKYWNGANWATTKTWLLAAGNSHWSFNSSQVQWTSGLSYRLQSRAFDNKSHIEIPTYGINFRFDTTLPYSYIMYPTNNSVYKSLVTSYGRAYDTGLPGIASVYVSLIRMSDNYYWNGQQWSSTSQWIRVYYHKVYNTTIKTTVQWFYNFTSVIWTNGTKYLLRSKAIDSAGNEEIPSYGVVFTISFNLNPYSSISYPWNNSIMYYFNQISGYAWAANQNLKISKVEITIKRLSDNKYWDGWRWNSTKNWLHATGTNNWYYKCNFDWDLGKYHIQSKATDNASNIESPGYGSTFTVKIYITTTINVPVDNSTLNSLDIISGTSWVAYNNSNITKVEIFILRLTDNKYWNGAGWNSTKTWLLTTGTYSWSYNSNSVTWTNNTQYLVRSRATDYLANTDHQSPINRFTIKFSSGGTTNPPTSSITFPANNSVISAPSLIYGTAKAYGNASLSHVNISIIRLSDYRGWSGSAWVINLTLWLPTSGTTSWQYNSTNVIWKNGTKYLIRSRATDNKQNVERPSHGNIFTIKSGAPQTSRPTSKITSPANNSYLKSLSSITGTASTPSSNTSISKVEILINCISNNKTWNGNNWTLTQNIWLLATGTTSWSYNTNSISWTGGNWYLVKSRATDNMSNIEQPSYGNKFMIDNRLPSSSISNPKNNTVSAAISKISGTAKDIGGSGVAYVDITIQRLSDSYYWNGTAWSSSITWLRTNGKYSWYYNLISTGLWAYNQTYRIRSRATDRANNVEITSYGNLYTYRIVPTKPWSYITSPSNNSYLNKLNKITGKAYSNLNYSTVTKVEVSIKRLSDNRYWNGSGWLNINIWLLATGTNAWSYSTSSVIWTSNTYYLVQSRATDNRSQVELPSYGKKFLIDMIMPQSSITDPVDNTTIKKLNFINGTGSDTGGAGLLYIQISLKRLSDNRYWDGYKWNSSNSWIKVAGTNSWSYNANQSMWTDNTQYLVQSRATDSANNIEIPGSGHKFTIKWSAPSNRPSSSISSPSNNSLLNSLKLISGSAVDYSSSGLKKVEIIIKNLNTSKYWAGSTWSSTETWLKALGTSSWSFNTSMVTWSTAVYLIRSKATDNKSKIEIPSYGTIVNMDLTNPSSTIKIPTNNLWLKALEFINGTSNDNSNSRSYSRVAKVEISIYREINQRYWDGSKWTENKSWLLATGTTVWYYDCRDVKWFTHNKFIIRSRATDLVGNVETPSSGNSFIYDNVPPKGLFISLENGRKLTNIPFVKVKLKFEETQRRSSIYDTCIYEMSFSLNGNSWTSWEPFANQTTIVLPEGDGNKRVYFRVRDSAGNVAEPVFDSIILDTTAPQNLIISINNDAIYSNSMEVNLKLTASDLTSGLNNMSFSVDGVIWSSWEPFATEKFFTLLSGNGEKTIYFRIDDKAGNTAEPVMDSIILDTKPPEGLTISINQGDEYTNEREVELQLDGYDSLSGINKMAFSFDSITWTAWEVFSAQKRIILLGGDGEKMVYLRLIDTAGNIAVEFDSITLDTTPPHSLVIIINDGAETTDSAEVTLELSAIDDLSGISQMLIKRHDNMNLGNWEPFTVELQFFLSSSNGKKVLYFTVMDNAGNIAPSVEASIILNMGTGIIDSDSDGVPDTLDAFPNDPAASLNSDSDGYPDKWNLGKSELDSTTGLRLDAFPKDHAASLDSDGDEYPDCWNPGMTEHDSITGLKLDAFPQDPDKFEETTAKAQLNWGLLLIFILIVIIILLGLFSSITIKRRANRNRASQRPGNKYIEDKVLHRIREEILNDKVPMNEQLPNQSILIRLDELYRNNEISREVYLEIKQLYEDD